jgi:Icc-related predicted phosphoesterase
LTKNGLGLGPEPRDQHQGLSCLRACVEAHPQLALHVFGHIHEGAGRGLLSRPGLEPLVWVNATTVDVAYARVHQPVSIEFVPLSV